MVLLGVSLFAARGRAQQPQKTVTGRVTGDDGTPVPYVTVIVKGTNVGTQTNTEGRYYLRAQEGQVLQFRTIGFAQEERPVTTADVVNVQLRRVATKLDEVEDLVARVGSRIADHVIPQR